MSSPVRVCLAVLGLSLGSQVFAMTVDFDFKRKHQCSDQSPALTVKGIPAGTIELSVTMIDHDMKTFDHGAGFVQNGSGFPAETIIPEGALKSYKGPCPPNFSSFGHDYEFIVKAKSKDAELAKAGKKKTFSAEKVPE